MTKKLSSKRRKLIVGGTSSSSEHSLAADVIASNEDLLTEILLHVPAKSLIRFKCVSKHWLSLISDSQFSSNHARRNPLSSISGLYLYFKPWSCNGQIDSVSLDGRPSLPTLAFLNGVVPDSTTTRISHSCNGLMLFSNGLEKVTYIVCNLTTKKHSVLPVLGDTSSVSIPNMFGAYLAFDPLKSPHYKVVLVNYSSELNGCFYLIDIYSSESASWRHMRVTGPPGYSFAYRVFWNGAIHWMNHENYHIRFDVDADAEKIIGTPLPRNSQILSEDKIWYFGECSGHLFLVQRSDMGFRILEMGRDSNTWIVKYRVNLEHLTSVFPKMADKMALLCVLRGTKAKDFELVLAIPGKVILYNRNCKTWKVLYDVPPNHESPYYNYAYVRAYQFIESLSPV